MSFPNKANRSDESNAFNNNNNNGDNDVDKITAEGVFQSFLMLAQGKFSSSDNVKRLDEIYNRSPDYKAEKDLLMRINNNDNSLTKAIAVGFGSFLVLRRGPRILSRWLIQRQRTSSSERTSHGKSYKFDKTSFSVNSSKDPFQTAAATTRNKQSMEQERPGLFFRSIKLGVDLFVSLSMAAYSAIFFTNTPKMIQDVADIPLVEGRSLISDELCADFYEQYRHYPREIFEHKKNDVLLHSITRFVQNCQRRQTYEHQIQQQEQQSSGWDTHTTNKYQQQNQHVFIPPPGVPRDINVEIDWANNFGGAMIKQKKDDTNTENLIFDADLEKETRNEYDISSSNGFTIEEGNVDITDKIDFENENNTNDDQRRKHKRSWWSTK